MDKLYIKQVLDRLVAERTIHDEKFADNATHGECIARFDRVIESLRHDLGIETPRLDFSVSESALPDAIADAPALEQAAQALEKEQNHELAETMRHKSREIVFKEMNELDGFDR